MTKSDKIYRIVGMCHGLVHVGVFVFVIIAGFFPFREQQNFYETFTGFFGETLSTVQPYLIMALLLLSCVFAFLEIKRPFFTVLALASSYCFYTIVFLPFAIEAVLMGFSSRGNGASMAICQVGFDLIERASYIVYLDIAFLIYAFALVLIEGMMRGRNRKK